MSHLFFQDKYFDIYTDLQDKAVTFIRTHNEVLIVPLTAQEEVLMTTEPSKAFQTPTLILPGGRVEPTETPEQTALRELQEEIGYTATHLQFLGELRPWSKYLTLRSFLYIARGLIPSRLVGDETYPILVESTPLDEFESLIQAGRLLDARIIAALYLTRTFLKTQPEPT